MEKMRKWKEKLEMKGLKVNVGKTKVMNCKVGSVGLPLEETSKWPCGVCSKGVRNNSILCMQCSKWVRKRCSKVKGKLGSKINF